MRAKRTIPLFSILTVLLFSLISSVAYAQQIYHGDGATNNGTGGWTISAAKNDQCLNCHQGGGFSSYLMSGHKNELRKVTPGQPWAGSDGTIYQTTDDLYGSGSTYDWTTGKVTVAGDVNTVRDLFYTFGAWIDRAQLNTVFDGGFTGEQYPNGNYGCARCHTTGYNFDASAPEPTTYKGIPITDAQFSRIPDTFTSGTGSWHQDGIQCERCHNADNGLTNHTNMGTLRAGIPTKPLNQSGTALCIECHRQDTADSTANTLTLTTNLMASDGGSCSDGVSPDYPTCIAAAATWNYAPFFDSDKGQTFLNSSHARFTGTLTLNKQNSPDLSVNMVGVYNSAFKDPTTGQNSGCMGCHSPHESTVTSTTPFTKNCNDCHSADQHGLQTMKHPTGPGTPFPTGTSADIPKSCAVCHMANGYHLVKISVDPNYSTFPTAAQLNSTQETANKGSDGMVSADVDIACGQCHVGSGTIGFTTPSDGAPVLSKAALVAAATNIHFLPRVATPTLAPQPMTYSTAQSVTLFDGTSGATVYYTADGSAPTTASKQYTGVAIPVSKTTTIRAIAVAGGYALSTEVSGTYTITVAAPPPNFSVNPATYNTPQSVGLSDSATGVNLYYTTDGSMPTIASKPYAAPIVVSTTTTIRAIAAGNGYVTSQAIMGIFRIIASAPTFSPDPYTYNTVQSVTLADTSLGVTIYYTTDGSTPTTASKPYAGPIAVSTTTTIRAIAAGNGYAASAAGLGIYRITALPPTFSPNPYTYKTAQSVTLADTSVGVTIYYTTDGSMPTIASKPYAGPIAVSTTTTIRAIAAGNGFAASSAGLGIYRITVQ